MLWGLQKTLYLNIGTLHIQVQRNEKPLRPLTSGFCMLLFLYICLVKCNRDAIDKVFKKWLWKSKNMWKNCNYFKKYLINSQNSGTVWKLPRYIVICIWIFSNMLYRTNFSMNEQLNFISRGFLVYNYLLLISRYKFQEPQMPQAVLILLIFDRSIWWVHYTRDAEKYLVSSQVFLWAKPSQGVIVYIHPVMARQVESRVKNWPPPASAK